MRLFYILIFFSFFGFSQTNEVLINQALQTAESQNITTQAQAIQALAASGMTEAQARQLAAQRGISYDELLNDYFSDEINIESSTDPDTSILVEATMLDDKEVIEEEEKILNIGLKMSRQHKKERLDRERKKTESERLQEELEPINE